MKRYKEVAEIYPKENRKQNTYYLRKENCKCISSFLVVKLKYISTYFQSMKIDKNSFAIKTIMFAFVLLTVGLIVYKPLLLGAVAGAMVVAFKAGIGCRYSAVGKRAIFALSLTYLATAAILGYFLEQILQSINQLISYTVIFHAAISLLLIFTGYQTIKRIQWCDVSDKTFLAIAVPCPVCFGATLISCYFVSEALNISGILVGLLVGAIIAIGIILLSAGKRENPEKLGKIMILLGVYYIFSMLLIPAIIQGMSLRYSVSESFSPYSLLLLFILALGFVKGVRR